MTEQFLHDFKDGNGLVLSHRHKNGGGIVANTAHVDDTCIIAPTAQVGGNAMVVEKCKILGNTRVLGNAHISGKVILEDEVEVSGTAELKYDTVLFGAAKVSIPPKVVLGFDHPVIITDNHIFLGCHCFDMEQWDRAAPIIKVNGYPTKTANHIHRIVSIVADIHFNLFIEEGDEVLNH